MNNISTYIIEKLHISKGMKTHEGDNEFYIIHPKNDVWVYVNKKYVNSIFQFDKNGLYYAVLKKDEILDIIKNVPKYTGFLDIFKIKNPSIPIESKEKIKDYLENSNNSIYNREDFEKIFIDNFLNESNSVLEKLHISKGMKNDKEIDDIVLNYLKTKDIEIKEIINETDENDKEISKLVFYLEKPLIVDFPVYTICRELNEIFRDTYNNYSYRVKFRDDGSNGKNRKAIAFIIVKNEKFVDVKYKK